MKHTGKRSLGLIGYGAFGRLIRPLLSKDFAVKVYDPAPINDTDAVFTSLEDVAKCDVIIIATPVQCLEHVAQSIAPFLRPGTLVLDVASVKLAPASILSESLPDYVDVLCTHPLFGPKSISDEGKPLKIVLCPVRGRRVRMVQRWLESLAFDVHVISADEHDRDMAVIQGVTHFVANVLTSLGPLPSLLTTPSFEQLLKASQMVSSDSDSVTYAVGVANPYAKDIRHRFIEKANHFNSKLDQLAQSSSPFSPLKSPK